MRACGVIVARVSYAGDKLAHRWMSSMYVDDMDVQGGAKNTYHV